MKLILLLLSLMFVSADSFAENTATYGAKLNANKEMKMPVSPITLQAIVQKLQNMSDPEGESGARMIECALSGLEVKRLSVSDSEWIYAKNVELKEIEGGFVMDFKGQDAFVLQVTNYHIASAEISFKNQQWFDEYKNAMEIMEFMEVPYLQGKKGVYMQPGSADYFSFNNEDNTLKVSYESRYFEEPTDLSPYDVIACIAQPSGEIRELAEYRDYKVQDNLTTADNANNEWFLAQGCTLKKDSDGVIKIKETGESYNGYSYIHITETDNEITDVFFVSYADDVDKFVEALIAYRFMPMEDTRVTPSGIDSGYAMTFKDPDETKADLRVDKNNVVYLHLVK